MRQDGGSARRAAGLVLWGLLLLARGAWAAGVSPAAEVPAWVLKSPPGPQDDTVSARLKSCLLQGDMQCVVNEYLLLKDMGRMPGWLVAFQNAFAAASRRAGECERVARAIHQGLLQFGQRPAFIRFTVEGQSPLLGFDLIENGVVVKNLQVSTLGYHVAVKLGDRVVDAYTGLAGLPLAEYMVRLSTAPGSHVIHHVVETL
jgi:hypothetical protein